MLIFLLAYLGGVLTILSPCVLPVLPFVFARSEQPFRRSGLPILLGMAVTFTVLASLAAVGGAWLVEVNQYGRYVAMLLLLLLGMALVFPSWSERMMRPFVSLGGQLQQRADGQGSVKGGLLLGVALGFLWAPCAGPILGLVLAGAALQGANLYSASLLLAFALGAATSLAVALLAGGHVIAWLKRAERDPNVLTRKMKYDEAQNPVPEQYTKPVRSLVSGQSYTVDELLQYMMNYSDNKATSLLFNALSAQELGYVLDNMDINNNPNEEGNSLTVHGYSGFFRILYNAAYLNRDMSEKALRLLSLQDFPLGGIAAGVPKGIRVAAKFGEFVPENRNSEIQLHEFGIVYHPKGHYILGIMTRGHDFAAQADIIREISKIIYSEVDASIRN